nr:MAG TPA_asm: hypothetical protein [Caudoviricetes sp.]
MNFCVIFVSSNWASAKNRSFLLFSLKINDVAYFVRLLGLVRKPPYRFSPIIPVT